MIDKELLDILICPEDRTPLSLADEVLMEIVNRAIESGTLTDRSSQPVESRLAAGLVRLDGKVLYPVLDGIPVLLVEKGILLDQLS